MNFADIVPILIPACIRKSDLGTLLDRLDGVVLTGGRANIEPHHYGGEAFPDDEVIDPDRDKTVLDIIPECVQRHMPIFGICIGHQLMALALGAKTHKMDRGHRGANHPVKDLTTGKIEITSQNHGFVVDPDSLPAVLEVSHISLFDQSVEGLRHTSKPAFCVQYHPESSPGPHDSWYLFERFTDLMEKTRA